jgi:pantetheine-phosphate adenylyltransferase
MNSQKSALFPLEQRIEWIHDVFTDEPKVTIDTFEKLTAEYCKKVSAHWILRGLRNASDFDYEKTISQLNFIIGEGVETFFLISQPQFSHISSTIVREIIKGGGDASPFLPKEVKIGKQ